MKNKTRKQQYEIAIQVSRQLFWTLMFIVFPSFLIYAEKGEEKSELSLKEDSLYKEMEAMPHDSSYFPKVRALEMLFMDSTRFLFYADLKEKEARKQNRMDFVCESYSDRAIYYSNWGNLDSFYYWKNKMDPIAIELKEFNYYFYLCNLEVGLLIRNSQIEKAGRVAKEMYETAKYHNSQDGIIASKIGLGVAMRSAKKYREALEAYKEAWTLMSASGKSNSSWKLNALSGLILCCDFCEEYEDGLAYADQEEKVLEDMKAKNSGSASQGSFFLTKWAELRSQKSLFYVKLKDYPSAWKELCAIKLLYRDLPINRKMEYHLSLSDYYEAKGLYQKALEEFKIGAPYFEERSGSEQPELIEKRARLMEHLGSPSEALGLYKQLIGLKDSLNTAWLDSQLNELRTIYDVDHLEMQNQKLEIKNKHNLLRGAALLIGLMIIALVFISVLYYRLSKVKKDLEKSQSLLMDERDRLVRSKEELRVAKENAIEARDLALKAERKESFFANMSHEIRTPLNAIVGFSNLLVEDDELSPEERHLFINTINQNCDQLLKLVNDVLNLSRMESDKMQFVYADFNLTGLVSEIYSTHQMMIPNGLEFLKELPAVPVFVHVDGGRLKQVLSNFINNAVKFTQTGYIKVGYEVRMEEHMVTMFVEDTGRGIPVEHQKKIFDRFYKQNDTDQGTGLGLSICSVIAEKLHGRLDLTSEVGKGSRFSIFIPYDDSLNKKN